MTQPRRKGAAVLSQANCLTWWPLHVSEQLPSYDHSILMLHWGCEGAVNDPGLRASFLTAFSAFHSSLCLRLSFSCPEVDLSLVLSCTEPPPLCSPGSHILLSLCQMASSHILCGPSGLVHSDSPENPRLVLTVEAAELF